MTVKEVIKELSKYPEDMEVFMAERKTEFSFGLLNSVREQSIDFMDEPNGKVLSKMLVVILDEE